MPPIDPKLHLLVLVRHSAAPKDVALAEELLAHLRPLQHSFGVDVWSEARIRPGDDSQREIQRAIEEADVALLLLSADFLNTDGLVQVEVPHLLERHQAGKLRVIPVVLRSCLWEVHSWLKDLQPLPRGGKAVGSFSGDARDEVLIEVAKDIAALVAPATPAPVTTPGVSPASKVMQRDLPTGRASMPRSHGSSLPPHNLPPRRFFIGRERELAHIDEMLNGEGRRSIARVSLWGLGGVGKSALALEYAHRALARNQYPGGVWWVMAEGRPLDAMRRLEAVLRARAIVDMLNNDEATYKRIENQRLALEAQKEPSLLVLDNLSERGFLDLLPGNKVRVLVTTRDRSVAVGEDVWLDVLTRDEARALAIQIAGSKEGDKEALERVVFHMLGGIAVAVEVAARAVKLWAGDWGSYEKLLYKQPGKALDRENDRSEHYLPGIFAAIDASMARCNDRALRLLEGLAAFAADSVPLAWALGAANLDPEDVESQEALGALDGLGLMKVERSVGVASLHRLVHARVRARTVPETWRETRRRAVMQVASWITTATQEQEMGAIDAYRAHIDEALAAAESDEDAVMWSKIANGLAIHLTVREEYDEAQSLLKRAMAFIENAHDSEHPEFAMCLSSLKRVHQHQEYARLALEIGSAQQAARHRAEEEARRAEGLAREAKKRWKKAIPECLARYWGDMQGLKIDLAPIRHTLEVAYPDLSIRSLVLFEWIGSSLGPWNAAPTYESVPELLLLEYPTHDLVAALTSHPLASTHVQGAIRYFAGWRFFQQKRHELDELPEELKRTFVTHSLAVDYEEGQRVKIKRAFG